MKHAVVGLCVLLMISAGPAFAADADPGVKVGAAAPAFEASDVNGTKITSADLARAGKPVVIVFWGLRCGACLEEIPAVNQIYSKYKGKVEILGVDVDGIDAATLSGAMKKKEIRIDYTVVADPELKLADLLGMTMAPLTLVVDGKGIVRYRHENYAAGDEKHLDELLSGLVGETSAQKSN